MELYGGVAAISGLLRLAAARADEREDDGALHPAALGGAHARQRQARVQRIGEPPRLEPCVSRLHPYVPWPRDIAATAAATDGHAAAAASRVGYAAATAASQAAYSCRAASRGSYAARRLPQSDERDPAVYHPTARGVARRNALGVRTSYWRAVRRGGSRIGARHSGSRVGVRRPMPTPLPMPSKSAACVHRLKVGRLVLGYRVYWYWCIRALVFVHLVQWCVGNLLLAFTSALIWSWLVLEGSIHPRACSIQRKKLGLGLG